MKQLWRLSHLLVGLGVMTGVSLLACTETGWECECPADKICNSNGVCVTKCSANTDCGGCGVCQQGICIHSAECSFSLGLEPNSVSLNPSASETVTVQIDRAEGFVDEVTMLPVYGAPPGVTFTFDPEVTTGSTANLTIDAGASVASTTATLKIRGQGEGFIAGSELSLAVEVPDPGYSLAPNNPSAVTDVYETGQATVQIDITRVGGHAAGITFSLDQPPAGFSATFEPPVAEVADTSTVMTLAVPLGANPGQIDLTVKGQSASDSETTAVAFMVITGLKVEGIAADSDGVPLANATVMLNHDAAARQNTTSNGGFIFSPVAPPYTLTVVSEDRLQLAEYRGLALEKPAIVSSGDGPGFGLLKRMTLTGSVNTTQGSFPNPLLPEQHLVIGGTGNILFNLNTDRDRNIDGQINWSGASPTQVDLVALEWEDATPATFGSYGTMFGVELTDSTSLALPSPLPLDLDTTAPKLDLEWDLGPYRGNENEAGIFSFTLAGARFFPNMWGGSAWETSIGTGVTTVSSFPFPEGAGNFYVEGRRPETVASSNVGEYQLFAIIPITSGSSDVEYNPPGEIQLWPISPPDDRDTPLPMQRPTLTWQPVEGAAIYIVSLNCSMPPDDYRLTFLLPGETSELQLPDYSELGPGFSLPGKCETTWDILAIAGEQTFSVDAYAAQTNGGLGALMFPTALVEVLFSGSARFVTALACDPPVTEICDGIDNDCNDLIDDVSDLDAVCIAAYPGADHVSTWACSGGACAVATCEAGWQDNGGLDDGCEAACTPSGAEVCDNLDNDCDGEVDEDFLIRSPCTVNDCHGVWVCVDVDRSECQVPASAEVCDNIDNDCNGIVDDPLEVGSRCACANGSVSPKPEVCGDLVDDDCNGLLNDGCYFDPCPASEDGDFACVGDLRVVCDGDAGYWIFSEDCTVTGPLKQCSGGTCQ